MEIYRSNARTDIDMAAMKEMSRLRWQARWKTVKVFLQDCLNLLATAFGGGPTWRW